MDIGPHTSSGHKLKICCKSKENVLLFVFSNLLNDTDKIQEAVAEVMVSYDRLEIGEMVGKGGYLLLVITHDTKPGF